MSAANRIAGNQSDNDLGYRTNQFLKVEHIEPRHAIIPHVARVTAHTLVSACAKCIFAVRVRTRAGQQNDADRLIFARVGKRVVHFGYGLRTECIPFFRPIDGHFGNAVSLVIEDVLVRLNRFPGGFHKAKTLVATPACATSYVVFESHRRRKGRSLTRNHRLSIRFSDTGETAWRSEEGS